MVDGTVDNAYALVRPPGHHAGPAGGCGYCVFSNTALGGRARSGARAGLERVAIVDWDVHHGNGTQDSLLDDPTVLTISLHQEDLFPPHSRGCVEQTRARATAPARTSTCRCPRARVGPPTWPRCDRVVIPALERSSRRSCSSGAGLTRA